MIVQNKKAIVLLMTLMFIMAISALIIKNLNDANSYIEESNSDTYYIKSLISVDNIKNEFFDYFLKNKEQIPSLLENESLQEGVDLEYGDIKAKVSFKKYEDRYDINALAKEDKAKIKDIENLFLENNVFGFSVFKTLVISYIKKYGDIDNFEQINTLVELFIEKAESDEIKTIQDNLSFIDTKKQTAIIGHLDIEHSNRLVISDFIFDITEKKIKGFNIAFK
ncbi:hypothetical protein [Arcobacter sp. F2176]|uniref:hypothetical protein n=1 Tax=Arcobacter sp. F2176 TaxID=2044511 RepID=UPI00100B8A22|nr:hypothetical protein [Arcobacter sp. F2176]RXJ80217.1 hypothetical protein CRU95_12105 [Arcobacter sp. F2176]